MSIVFKIIKRLIVLMLSAIVFGVIAFLAWRIISSGNPKEMETLTPNDRLAVAYTQSEDGLYMFRQKQRSITSGENNYGYFSVSDYKIIPSANQIQTLIRYNNSTLSHTAEDHGLDHVPQRDEDVYDITLVFAIDLTPDNEKDNFGNAPESVRFIRCGGKQVASDSKNIYNFRKMVFDLDDAEIDLNELMDSKLLLAIYVDVCYKGDLNYDKPDGTLCLYDFKSQNITIKMKNEDVKALERYIDKGR